VLAAHRPSPTPLISYGLVLDDKYAVEANGSEGRTGCVHVVQEGGGAARPQGPPRLPLRAAMEKLVDRASEGTEFRRVLMDCYWMKTMFFFCFVRQGFRDNTALQLYGSDLLWLVQV
jgi:hypothetical protein